MARPTSCGPISGGSKNVRASRTVEGVQGKVPNRLVCWVHGCNWRTESLAARQMSLPARARHRWGLDDGGEVGFLDLGDAVVIVPERRRGTPPRAVGRGD